MKDTKTYLMNDSEANKSAEVIAKDIFANWIEDLEEKEQPESCSIDNPDCENCGS